MRLPAALAPWYGWLSWFDDKVAAALGPMLVALDPLLGLPGPRLVQNAHEPDGVDGLQRRGNYERLLVSEWAMADAMPDEFLRRAAGGEHLFLAPRMRAPRVDRELVALFDAGPEQLGAPRLVHIALWILLARRAERAGARFCWGVLQAPGTIVDAQSPATLRQLLEARSFERASDAHRDAWRAALAASVGERWSIGAQPDVDATHAATIRLRYTGEIDVAVGARRAPRRTTLQPPRDDLAVRLLQGRFAPVAEPGDTVPGRWRFARQPAPLFSWRGNHIAVQQVGTDAVFVLHVTGNARKRQAPRRVDASWVGQLVAATVSENRWGGIVALGDEIGLWNGSGVRRVPRPGDDALRLVPGQADRLWCERFGGGVVSYVMLDDARRLVRWRESSAGVRFDTIAQHVVGAVRAGQERLAYVTFHERRADLHYWRDNGHARHVARLARVEATTRPLRCELAGARLRSVWHGAVAIEWRSEVVGDEMRHWSLVAVRTDRDDLSLQRIRTDADWKVIGPVRSTHDHAVDGFGLLAIDRRKHRLVVAGTSGHAELYAAGGEIATVGVSSDGTRVAFVDEARQIVVLSHDGRVLVRTNYHDPRDD
ncbi:hypothetical protein [Tahibacter soli]|uniref:Uncharacterized protein n=1 Tax=Tahibacter soli TaxID=2983605 RepID=A0A9X3YMK0_9GAMM|nr:hypothetical protein [Tahibacter soli]MDC8013990.1 hypothetical protein [Tahibacter soli]